MAGRLGEWTVEDLLQIAKVTQKTTSIELIGEECSGVIYLREGSIVHAEIVGRPVPAGERFSQVVEIVVALAGIEEGTFEFGSRDVPDSDERPIDVKAVFAAVEKDMAREKRITDLGISPGEGLGAARHVTESLVLKPAVWQLLSDLIEPFTLADLERRVGRRRAVAMVLALEAVGVLARDVPISETADALAPDPEPQQPVSDPAPVVEAPPVDDSPIEEQFTEAVSDGRSPIEETETPSATPTDVPVTEEEHPTVTWDSEPVPLPPEEAYSGEPIVEIFGMETPVMHEVVTPSETTLVSDVLGDLRSRFRSGRGQTLDPGYED